MKRLMVIACAAGLAAWLVAFDSFAVAGSTRAPTHLQLQIQDDSVRRNQTIVLTGEAHSNRSRCKNNRRLRLFIDGSRYAVGETNDNGAYRFEVPGPHPRGEHTFQTRMSRDLSCTGARSNVVRAQVGG